MKTYNIIWNENMIQEFQAEVSEQALLEWHEGELPTDDKSLQELVKAYALETGEFERGKTRDCDPDPYITEFSVDEDEEEDTQDERQLIEEIRGEQKADSRF